MQPVKEQLAQVRQGLYQCWKTWKVLGFYCVISLDWKVQDYKPCAKKEVLKKRGSVLQDRGEHFVENGKCFQFYFEL